MTVYFAEINGQKKALELSIQPQIGGKIIFDGTIYVIRDIITTLMRKTVYVASQPIVNIVDQDTVLVLEPVIML